MLIAKRHELLLSTLSNGGQSVKELADNLDVSESTVRRDLAELEKQGLLERRYGGAMLTRGSRSRTTDSGRVETPLTQYYEMPDYDLRVRIAKQAAAMVREGSVIILDIGSTTPLIARELRGKSVTIVTSNLAVLDEVRNDDTVEVVLVGGVLRRNQQSLVGPIAEQAVAQISADIMFLSCTGVRGESVVDNMAVETPIKQALIGAAQTVVLLASEAKFPGTGGLQLCPLDAVDTIITTRGTPESMINNCRKSGRKVVTA
ncbi:DeoR family transcriptional regulator [Bombiscardovia nodaiensis]|uniref:DeoR family transcriptional regulator n=1 Tax=Bombiscardovia nodaiensis TaxID=2932181 RepID=A0ABN6SDS3_9BIFI|nr:DeoR family transcriptional regulator [Bombiscardovia nodaiensis]